MQTLLEKLKRDLYAKQIPGSILCDLKEEWLEKLVVKYPCNTEALMLGAFLSDYKIQEAIQLRKINEHIRMAIDYASQIFERYSISQDIQDIVLEIITTHHGEGEQKYIESKLFMNADSMAFLEPKGFLHIFGSEYKSEDDDGFRWALKTAYDKAEEKLALINLDQDLIKEANMLFEKLKWIVERVGVNKAVPELYK